MRAIWDSISIIKNIVKTCASWVFHCQLPCIHWAPSFFCDTENRKNSQNLGRKQNSQNFTENVMFDAKISKYRKYKKKHMKTKEKPIFKTKHSKLRLHRKSTSVAMFSQFIIVSWKCHVLHMYVYMYVYMYIHVYVTEDHRIWSLEHRRTQIWHFTKIEKLGTSMYFEEIYMYTCTCIYCLHTCMYAVHVIFISSKSNSI